MSEFWNRRYDGAEYYYGTEPNSFLVVQAVRLAPGSRILSLGEGEGRNAVHLARLGHRVTALDASATGLAKAQRLAVDAGVTIDTVCADLADHAFEPDAWDAVVSIWCHLPSALRRRVYGDVVRALRPGGLVLLEAYTPDQIGRGTGGPREVDLLSTAAALTEEWAGLTVLSAEESVREVHEGTGHRGTSAVVQWIGRKES
jgi:SAM-dependent methyltransferase